jgi:exosome complex component RRP43
MVDLESLRIKYTLPRTEDDLPDEEPKIVTKAYWVLYVDILCLALDGNALDAAWLAVVAALRDTTLPRAWWDQDKESILCSPLTSEASKLNLANIPLAVTFAILSTASPYKQTQDTRTWTIADPDALEEDVCGESLTVVLTTSGEPGRSISRITRSGGCLPNAQLMRRCIGEAEKRCGELETVLRGY